MMPGDRQSDPRPPLQAGEGAASRQRRVIDYRSPRVPVLEPEPDHAAIARRVYDQMSQEAPPSVTFAVIGRLIPLLAMAAALAPLVAAIAMLWRSAGGDSQSE